MSIIVRFPSINPYRFAEVDAVFPSDRGVDLYGFVLSVGINYGRRQLFDFELLSSPVNDLSKLIY
jgi:hypothetical protein